MGREVVPEQCRANENDCFLEPGLGEALAGCVWHLKFSDSAVEEKGIFCTHRAREAFGREISLLDFDLQYFWNWSRFVDYLQCCLFVSVVCTLVTYIFIDAAIFVEGLGFVAVLMEAMLGVPQLWQNFQKRSTQGMSVAMVLLWTAGDTFKTSYFIINESPDQFWLCGILQICIDIAILVQVYAYDLQTHSKYG
ncbi:hypothetical protein NDU88_004265 [Pleurodeles waltl]|uniref:PQ-loop repeat-containing protein 1 n=1 Tax=Pleurodeles waltl TaxID=8319 RepID=A0AAV7KXA8_PLEWA|nr:hypothetical protein NDU88_004265 [Pleurodeles waltl]